METATLVPGSAVVFMLMLMRVGTMLMLLPGLGGKTVPTPIRLVVGLVVTLVLVPFNHTDPSRSSDPNRFVVAMAQELLVGLLLGFGVAAVFGAIEMAGGLITMQAGLNLAVVFNPATTGTQSGALETFYMVIAALIFFGVNGHHLLLLGLQRSFEALPIGTATISGSPQSAIVSLTGDMFLTALRIGLPVAGTLLVADAALGILNRMVPQMNVFFVGIPAKVFVAFAALLLTLPYLIQVLETLVTQGLVDALQHAIVSAK